MADPIHLLVNWPVMRGRRVEPTVSAGQIIRQDPLRQAAQIIARNELRVWFEPKWQDGRFLAARFPHCLICSIPVESDTPTLYQIPAWRPRPNNGVV